MNYSVANHQSLKDAGFTVHSWEDLLALGRASPVEPSHRPRADDLCTIMYTSGTTGEDLDLD